MTSQHLNYRYIGKYSGFPFFNLKSHKSEASWSLTGLFLGHPQGSVVDLCAFVKYIEGAFNDMFRLAIYFVSGFTMLFCLQENIYKAAVWIIAAVKGRCEVSDTKNNSKYAEGTDFWDKLHNWAIYFSVERLVSSLIL